MAKSRLIRGAQPLLAAARRLQLCAALLLAALLLALPRVASAQIAVAALPAASANAPALWRIQAGKSTGYLFGTVHALPRGLDWFGPHLAKALDRSKLLVLETVVPDSPAALQAAFAGLARLPAPRPLESRVPDSWRSSLLAAVSRLGDAPLNQSKTWAIALALTNLQAQRDGLDARLGAEAVLTARARMRDIPAIGLETPVEQLRNFDALAEKDQQLLLTATLADLPNATAQTRQMLGYWLTGDTDALAGLVNSELDRSPAVRELLLDNRNARWAAWIANRMRDDPGPIFIAVGAGHLSGPNNLIDQLATRGVRVERVGAAAHPERQHRGKAAGRR